MPKETVYDQKTLLLKALSDSPQSSKFLRQLHVRYEPMIVALAHELSWDADSFGELRQEGELAFLRTLRAFDPTAGTRLSTFLYWRIRGQMLHWRRDERIALTLSPIGHPVTVVSLDGPLPQSRDDSDEGLCRSDVITDESPTARLWEQAHRSMLRELMSRAFGVLSARQAQVMRLLFWDEATPSEIADRLGISRPRVTVLVRVGLMRLRGELVNCEA